MHIHGNRGNPKSELDAAYAAQQAARKREAEATRKKLLESATRLAAGNEDCIVSIGAPPEDAQDQAKQQNQREQGRKEDAEENEVGRHLSDWA